MPLLWIWIRDLEQSVWVGTGRCPPPSGSYTVLRSADWRLRGSDVSLSHGIAGKGEIKKYRLIQIQISMISYVHGTNKWRTFHCEFHKTYIQILEEKSGEKLKLLSARLLFSKYIGFSNSSEESFNVIIECNTENLVCGTLLHVVHTLSNGNRLMFLWKFLHCIFTYIHIIVWLCWFHHLKFWGVITDFQIWRPVWNHIITIIIQLFKNLVQII